MDIYMCVCTCTLVGKLERIVSVEGHGEGTLSKTLAYTHTHTQTHIFFFAVIAERGAMTTGVCLFVYEDLVIAP